MAVLSAYSTMPQATVLAIFCVSHRRHRAGARTAARESALGAWWPGRWVPRRPVILRQGRRSAGARSLTGAGVMPALHGVTRLLSRSAPRSDTRLHGCDRRSGAVVDSAFFWLADAPRPRAHDLLGVLLPRPLPADKAFDTRRPWLARLATPNRHCRHLRLPPLLPLPDSLTVGSHRIIIGAGGGSLCAARSLYCMR